MTAPTPTLPIRRQGDSCLHDALTELLGRDAGLPDGVPGQEIPAICARLGLALFDATGNLEIDDGTPVVFLVITDEAAHKAHAMYVAGHRIKDFLAWNVYRVMLVIVRPEHAPGVRYTGHQ